MRWLYQIFILIYQAGVLVVSWFSPKARLWRQGRKGQFKKMQAAFAERDRLAWFHCASLGEFEQGRPVIEAFRKEFPEYKVLLSFFSPSGFEIRKNYEQADYIFYLPLDTRANVRRFLNIWKPSVAIFVKYEFWFNYLNALHERRILSLVISANFRPGQHFFRPYGKWFRRQLKKLSFIFVQNEKSLKLLQKAGITNAAISGDTRFDRVAAIAGQPVNFPQFDDFARDSQILVAGSTWPADEALLLPLINNPAGKLKFIIAPHEIQPQHIQNLKRKIKVRTEIFSELSANVPADTRVLIIDRIGMLSGLYRLGTLAYIGGGFGRGIHNILEAVTFGLPVFFGPRHQQFAEALELIERGGAFPVHDAETLERGVKACIENPVALQNASAVCLKYIAVKKGATDAIIDFLKKQLP
ncbi:MAG: 3-deoxy-D-manno-octulosonic acid transferase [Bacteroidales bacterium]|nr:3-deoxy-D-manno-octulosonic acid transferase [Bacteroidales bacterium]